MILSISMNTIYYRGLIGTYNKDYVSPSGIYWFTQDKEYAQLYSDSTPLKFHINVRNSFNFKFRTLQVHVKLDDMLSRIQTELMDIYGTTLSKKEAMDIDDYIDIVRTKYSTIKMKRVWEWWESVPEITRILKRMRFDSIVAYEGRNDDIKTYGVFYKKAFKIVK